MLFAFRRWHLIVAIIFASANLLALCDCVCTDKNSSETDLAFTSERSIFDEDESIERAYGEPRPDAAEIDAFNYDICGKSRQRDWQSREKAWNCGYRRSTGGQRWSARNSSQQRISDGENALDGEFPSFVQLLLKKSGSSRTGVCGGTLIHSNLVITAAHCIEHMTSVTVVLDSNRVDGSGGYGVEADSWCHHSSFAFNRISGPIYDLGMIRLSRKVKYVPNRVWPACLLLDKRHKSNSACAVAGMGLEIQSSRPKRLKTLLLRRNCKQSEKYPYRSCYKGDSVGSACQGDSGSGVFCYDNCYAGDQRAFVVGAVSGGPDIPCGPGQRLTQLFADFNWMADSVRAMISRLLSGGAGDKLKCYGQNNNWK